MGRDNKLNHSNLVPRVSGCTGVTDVVFVPKEGQSSGNKYHQGPACCAKTRHPIFFFFFFVLIRIGYGAFIICYIHDSFFFSYFLSSGLCPIFICIRFMGLSVVDKLGATEQSPYAAVCELHGLQNAL